MSSPVVCVPPEMRLKGGRRLLVRERISAVPVVERGELVGIISKADLGPPGAGSRPRAHLVPPADAPVRLPNVVAEAMTREVIALSEDADLAEAGRLLERDIQSIPDQPPAGPPAGPRGARGCSDP
jgi:CBS domain-containing protein